MMSLLRSKVFFAVLLVAVVSLYSMGADRHPLPDFSGYSDVKQKKTAFFGYMLPLVSAGNQLIIEQRADLEEMAADVDQLSFFQQRNLLQLADRYGVDIEGAEIEGVDTVEGAGNQQIIDTLLLRVAPLPPSLVLAQAAIESAWGTSRFARQGNNLFGQWCYQKGCGLVPLRRSADSKHEVAKFDSVAAAVEAYLHNLNTHRAYKDLRVLRAELSTAESSANGHQLAQTLLYYSELRQVYVDEVQAVIRINKLHGYDEI
jgi:Bax protein|tara:strand:- start:376 stop:1152 length:777 start_codon:yes stop_codon:yes gene_type:complete